MFTDGGVARVGERARLACAEARDVVFISAEVLSLGPEGQKKRQREQHDQDGPGESAAARSQRRMAARGEGDGTDLTL